MADDSRDDQAGTPSDQGARKPRIHILLTFLGVFILLIVVFREVLFPFLMAIYIAYLVEPIVARVVKSRLFGIKWTRGPTIVTLYVLILGGLTVLGWVGIATLAKQVRSSAHAIEQALREDGYRATFQLKKPSAPSLPSGAEAPPGEKVESDAASERGILIPKDTMLVIAGLEYATLYPIRVTPDERIVSVLLETDTDNIPEKNKPRAESTVLLKDMMGLRYADAPEEKISIADAERLGMKVGGGATGFEYFVERRFISPIVKNLADGGFHVEPTLLRDYIAIQGEVVREDLPPRIVKFGVSAAGSLVFSIYEFFLILMLTAFIVMDRKLIAGFFRSMPPTAHRSAYDRFVRYIDDGLAGVIRGQLVICGVNGLLTYIGLLILGVPYATLLSVMAAIFSLIPVFGTIISSIPIVLIGTTKGLDTGLMALGWIVLIHIIEANVLNPMIMGSHARMHPVIIIFSLLAGEHAFGIWGALLAVPTMSLLQSSFRFYLHEIEGLPRPGGGDGTDDRPGWVGTLWAKWKARFAGGGAKA